MHDSTPQIDVPGIQASCRLLPPTLTMEDKGISLHMGTGRQPVDLQRTHWLAKHHTSLSTPLGRSTPLPLEKQDQTMQPTKTQAPLTSSKLPHQAPSLLTVRKQTPVEGGGPTAVCCCQMQQLQLCLITPAVGAAHTPCSNNLPLLLKKHHGGSPCCLHGSGCCHRRLAGSTGTCRTQAAAGVSCLPAWALKQARAPHDGAASKAAASGACIGPLPQYPCCWCCHQPPDTGPAPASVPSNRPAAAMPLATSTA
jgi:hypothetical protein